MSKLIMFEIFFSLMIFYCIVFFVLKLLNQLNFNTTKMNLDLFHLTAREIFVQKLVR